jgi:pilus assembly protein CpaF
MLRVTVTSDGKPPVVSEISQFPAKVGSGNACAVVCRGLSIRREHFEIIEMARGYKLIDLGSIRGTFVNGDRIVEYGPVTDADEIMIGGYKLRLTASISSSSARPSNYDSSTSAVNSNEKLPGLNNQLKDHKADAGLRLSQTKVTANSSIIEPESAKRTEDELVLARYLGTFDWRRRLHRALINMIDLRRKDLRQMSDALMRTESELLIREILKKELVLPPEIDKEALISDVLDEVVGLGPLERLLNDPTVSEIMVNGATEIFVERKGKLTRELAAFTSNEAVRIIIDRIVSPLGRRIDESSPTVDARLADGSRVNAVIPPLALKGPTITIRKFNKSAFTPEDYVRLNSASASMFEFLSICVKNRKNIIISGGTGSGKTTLLNALSNMIPKGERILTIEDAAELKLEHPHLVSLEARPSNVEGKGAVTIRDLVKNALRMRPDRIVVGECRGGEALDMLQAMNTGHDGSLTTVHSNGPRDALSRLEIMVLMSGMEIPISAIREQIASAVDIVVQQSRSVDGARRITHVCEVTGLENGTIQMSELFKFQQRGVDPEGNLIGTYTATNSIPSFYEPLRSIGHALDLSIFIPHEDYVP